MLVALELGELMRVDRRVPVRGVREVVELQHLCSGRGESQRQIAPFVDTRRAGTLVVFGRYQIEHGGGLGESKGQTRCPTLRSGF